MRFDSDDHTDGDSPDEFDSQKNSDDDVVGKAPFFCNDDKFDPRFALGMQFSNKKEFREAIHSHAIMTRRNLVRTRNDNKRIYARCKADGCSWHINAVKIRDELGFQIREYNHVHICGSSFNVKNVRINWLSQKYVEAFRSDPNRSAKGFRQDVIRQLRCNVSRGQAYATKRRCLQEIQGDGAEQYARLWDYAGALKNKNPGSTIIMNLEDADAIGKKKFKRFYVCFAAVKNGFLSGLVLSENKENWEWFLTLLKEDLNIIRDDAYTFISDKQKGILLAFEKVLLGVENRFCVRHLHGNMKTAGFKGLGYKKALWKAAKTTTVSQFQRAMQDIAELDVRCLECCILEAREKPILTMLEWIREYVITRMQQLRDRAERLWEGRKLCPRIKKIVDNNLKKAADCIPVKSDDIHYEVQCFDGARYTVDLKEKTCSCRSWDLTGIPCNHAMSAISAQVLDPDDFVHKCYNVDTFCKVYAPAIMPLDGLEMWEKAGYIPPVPPNFGRKKGRPARARRLEPDEVRKGKKPATIIDKLPRQRGKRICKFCHQVGHTTKGCKWKKFAEEFPVDDGFEQAVATEHVTAPVQQDEVIVNEDCPSVSQPEVVSQPETDGSCCCSCFDAGVGVGVVVHVSMLGQVQIDVPVLVPAPRFMHARVNIRAPPPMVGHPPGFVSRPTQVQLVDFDASTQSSKASDPKRTGVCRCREIDQRSS
ncbi:uncharacterized protein LOC110011996 [Sesamum indicum]|uniref:Uncharacterized protein LOC110011996 n=1 Tax=Sesamum indicum TaxID=4182 RepID=A0A8M8USR8_SESIN|nr:uncharacterized protein LOC110011996 [Sesamum indicum]